MKMKFKIALLVFAALLLGACQKSPKLYPLAGAPTDNPMKVAQIIEGSMLLRGVDGKRFGFSEIPNPLADILFVVKPGKHTFWMINIQRGHPMFLGDLRCYVIEADLEAGVTYRIDEDLDQIRAIIRREGSSDPLAIGRLVDQKEAYGNGCEWKKTVTR